VVKIRYDLVEPWPAVVWIQHLSYTIGYEDMLGHVIGVGWWWMAPPSPGAIRFFNTPEEAIEFYLDMVGSSWRIHSRCAWCFNSQCRKLPI